MNADDFHAAMKKLGCETYEDYAELLGVGRRSCVRYGTSDAPVPEVVVRLITMLQRHGKPRSW